MKKEYTEERYLKMVNATNDLKKLVSELGNGYTELATASKIVTLTKKGKISKLKATMLLREYPQMIKFLSDKPKVTKIPTRKHKQKVVTK